MPGSIRRDRVLGGADRARRTLERGVLLFRWVSLAWTVVVAITDAEGFRRPVLAWATLGLVAAWTTWLTVAPSARGSLVPLFDLAVCGWFLLASGLVVFDGDVVSGRPFFSAGYPISAALLWGVRSGPLNGVAIGALLGAALAGARPLNGVSPTELDPRALRSLGSGIVNYLVAGGAAGLVSRLLVASETAAERATDELVREREKAARLAERESLARRIHDSVLQALALVHKRGRELADRDRIPSEEVARLAEIAAAQEAELRALVLRTPEDAPGGLASLRAELESAARGVNGVPVTVSAVGAIWLPESVVREISAAVRQALENIGRHARAAKASVFAQVESDVLEVSVRDDGRGFVYDEASMRAQRKMGILKSMKGRIEELGGSMGITTAPGSGTEVEFRVPVGDYGEQT